MFGQLLLYILTFALFVIVGTFSYLMFDVILDVVEEQKQAREREKRRELK